MESIAIIAGIIGIFGGVGFFVYFSIRNKELLDELDEQDKKIRSINGKIAAYRKGYELEMQSNNDLIKANRLLHQDVKNWKNKYKNLSIDYNKVKLARRNAELKAL